MNKKEIEAWLKELALDLETEDIVEDMWGNKVRSLYLGTYMALDPCGRYHNIFSPNGATSKCERFWENLETVANDLGLMIESGEGDPCDIFLTKTVDTEG
jgi:hypothetical protein